MNAKDICLAAGYAVAEVTEYKPTMADVRRKIRGHKGKIKVTMATKDDVIYFVVSKKWALWTLETVDDGQVSVSETAGILYIDRG